MATVTQFARGEPSLRHPRLAPHGGDAACRVTYSKRIRDRVLNHAPGDVGSKHYNLHDYADEKREALNWWALTLGAIIGHPAGAAVAPLGDGSQEGAATGTMRGNPEQDVLAQGDQKLDKEGAPPVFSVGPETISALDELFLDLERILAAHPPPDLDAALAVQRRTNRVLAAFASFVSWSCSHPVLKAAISKFMLDHALRIEQLSDGVAHPTLTAATRSGRKFVTYDIWHARTYACAILE